METRTAIFNTREDMLSWMNQLVDSNTIPEELTLLEMRMQELHDVIEGSKFIATVTWEPK